MVTAALIVLYVIAAAGSLLLLTEHLDRRLEQRFPSSARRWARVFGEPVDPPTHVQVVTPRPCRACGRTGWCDEGCSLLDRLDAGETR